MAENLRENPAFERESIITQHGIFALLVGTLNNQIQVKYQSVKGSPFDSHDVIMSVFLASLFIYATASVAEVMLRARESTYYTLVGNLRLFASALAAILLLVILAPVLGCIISAIWACLFMGVAYESSREVSNILGQLTNKLLGMFTRLIARVRSRKEEPNQPRV
ncbi:PREDICTED: uncharacterized protein LOC105132101 [Populus euphratica]|uniref:Uncharacterized protein LOC105132101 n=1 Tax=Populus euphratica TaxID=75702 RepID=A0AAJ6XWK0_POPEU|nr:PREDICTED: uncharacterized protein LOC105132101 [Populus euphratica]